MIVYRTVLEVLSSINLTHSGNLSRLKQSFNEYNSNVFLLISDSERKRSEKDTRRIFKFASNVSKVERRKTKDLSSVCDKFIILITLSHLCKGKKLLLIVFN